MDASSLALRKGERRSLGPEEELVAEARVGQQDKKDNVILKMVQGVVQTRQNQQQNLSQAQQADTVQSTVSVGRPICEETPTR